MKITFISDLHGFYSDLEGGDLLLICGDLVAADLEFQYDEFLDWIIKVPYEKKIVIAGNHDGCIYKKKWRFPKVDDIIYLENSSYEYRGFKIHGCPQSMWFSGVNPKCTAFMCKTENEINKYWNEIPRDVNILMTHTPPYGILDSVDGMYKGSVTLRNLVISNYFKDLKFHAFGHIHECGGKMRDLVCSKFINCAYLDREYQPVHEIITLTIEDEKKSGDDL